MTSRLPQLLSIMRRLRAPDGCPWDRQQTFATIAPYTVEEAYEVADAIDRGDLADLRDELGDLLFQVVFHSEMASEQGAFDFEAVVGSRTSRAPSGRTSRPGSAAATARCTASPSRCRR
jgi:ATP diphosphatase